MGRSAGPNPSIEELRQALSKLISDAQNMSLSSSRRRRLQADVRAAIDDLADFLNELDPIRQPTSVFDPE